VGGSVIASVVCTHISFMDGSANPIFYRDAMFFAVLIRCSSHRSPMATLPG
jgi:hypothetical protein